LNFSAHHLPVDDRNSKIKKGNFFYHGRKSVPSSLALRALTNEVLASTPPTPPTDELKVEDNIIGVPRRVLITAAIALCNN
jgi:hypothetical protein